ncbi:MAG: hypothetical protein EXS01_02240 [Phycisphaerales bacterium]|nr:hypothetical protein [Phycisphaerales bacterium]
MPFQWIDGHLDLAYISMERGDIRTESADPSVRCVSLGALARGHVGVIAATIFVECGPDATKHPWGYRDENDWQGANRAAELQMDYYESLEHAGLVRIVRNHAELVDDSLPRLLILMEGADPIRDAGDVARWHARGVRMVGLTWALGSRFAGGNHGGGGLTAAGREVVAALDAHSILHDASHLSDAAFDDLLAATTRTIVASHSNARALMGSGERHIRDDQIREIAKRGGVVGLNLYGKFLAVDRPATIDDAIDHLQHIASVANSDTLNALGSDLDGGFLPDKLPVPLHGPEQYSLLTDALARRGWSSDSCLKFASGNWLRVFAEALPNR